MDANFDFEDIYEDHRPLERVKQFFKKQKEGVRKDTVHPDKEMYDRLDVIRAERA